jgi:hypothetical protein
LPCHFPSHHAESFNALGATKGVWQILREQKNPLDPQALALAALGWVLSDETHADRLLALTGIAPDELRARLGEAEVLTAVLDFVLQHEHDTIACAQALGLDPQALVTAHAQLNAPTQNADWGA